MVPSEAKNRNTALVYHAVGWHTEYLKSINLVLNYIWLS